MKTKTNKKATQTNVLWRGGNFSCRHPKLWKYIKSNVKAFFITGAITFVVTVSATVILHSRQVRYKNDKSVEQALNELYQKADELFAYHVGDEIQVNGIDFYVIADSGATQDYVVALKKEPLTVEEVNLYGGVGTENNHVNRYTKSSQGTSYNNNGYGGLAYYSSETCGYVNNQEITSGCTVEFNMSDIKHVLDNWSHNLFDDNELKEVDGYKYRIPTSSEMNANAIWQNKIMAFWSMSYALKSSFLMWFSYGGTGTGAGAVYKRSDLAIRPVINVKKTVIQKIN